jgi:type I restriction enzyme S subunit
VKAGWQQRRISDVAAVIAGQSPEGKFYNEVGIGLPFYQGKKEFGLKFLGPATTWTSQVTKEAAANDILMSVRAPVGPINFSTERICIGRGLAAIRAKAGMDKDFLFYFLLSKQDEISGKEGAVFASINKSEIESIEMAVPSLPEQQRIVAILDEAFEGIAIAEANTEKNLQNAREVFESLLQAIFDSRGSGWERVQLETLMERGWIESHLDGNHGGDYPRKEEFITEGVPYISANCLDGDRLDMSRAKYLSHERAALLRKGIAKNNDVLFAHNATVGPVSILQTAEPKVILGTSLTYYRCNPNHILPLYLAHYMRSFGFKSQYTSIMRQSTRNQVPITKQREFYHVIPPVNEQRAIIDQLDGIMENSQRLETILQQKLTALDELKQSLLHRAFKGDL